MDLHQVLIRHVCLVFCVPSCSEYYFSLHNLERDFFLRRKMDAQGFLPISLIASFHRVQALTMDINLIVEVLAASQSGVQLVLWDLDCYFLCSRLLRPAKRWSWWMIRSAVKSTRNVGPFRPLPSLVPLGLTSPSSSTVPSLSPDRRSAPQTLVSAH